MVCTSPRMTKNRYWRLALVRHHKQLSLLSFIVFDHVLLACTAAYLLFSEEGGVIFNSILSARDRSKLSRKLWSMLGIAWFAIVLTPVR